MNINYYIKYIMNNIMNNIKNAMTLKAHKYIRR